MTAPTFTPGPTPGPWHWSRVTNADGTVDAFLRGQPNELNDTLVTAMRGDLAAFPYSCNTANTRLIAAAPDLLAALRALVDSGGDSTDAMYRASRLLDTLGASSETP